MDPTTFYYRCDICQFEGELESGGPPLNDANCPQSGVLLVPGDAPGPPAARPGPPAPTPRWVPAAVLVLVVAFVLAFLGLMKPSPDVWVYVDSPHAADLVVTVDGRAAPIDLRAAPHFTCRSGTRRVIISRGGETVFDETKELRRADRGPAGKYLVSPEGPGRYYAFEVEYAEFERTVDDLVAIAAADRDTKLTPADDLLPGRKQAKLDRIYARQLAAFRRTNTRVVEGRWLEVHDSHYVLEYPSGSARLERNKPAAARSIVRAPSAAHAGRLAQVGDVHTPTVDDVRFLGDFLGAVGNPGGAIAAFAE